MLSTKCLYVFKQSHHAWNSHFIEVVLSMGFARCYSDHIVLLILILECSALLSRHMLMISLLLAKMHLVFVQVNRNLGMSFDVKVLGPLKYFLVCRCLSLAKISPYSR